MLEFFEMIGGDLAKVSPVDVLVEGFEVMRL